MSTETKTKIVESKSQPVTDIFNDVDNQEFRKLVVQSGIYIRGAVESYDFDGNKGESGWLQILHTSRPDSKKMEIETIKVGSDQYGWIDILNTSKQLKSVSLHCEIRMFGKRAQIVLCDDQPSLKLAT